MPENTTIGIPIELNERIRKLAATKGKELGLSKALSVKSYLEILINQEELRVQEKQ